MSKSTPGPWFADDEGAPLMVRARGCTVAEVIPQSTARANAKLIAAAPHLFEALRGLLEHYQSAPDAVVAAAHAAIAKAEGRS